MSKQLEISHLLRIAGNDSTALEILSEALADETVPIYGERPSGDIHAADRVQVDLQLRAELIDGFDPVASAPAPGATYSGLTPAQRGAFILWAQDPVTPAPPAFQRLLIAHVEVGLLDETAPQWLLRRELSRWAFDPTWHLNQWHGRALLLALWLTSNGEGIVEWTSTAELPADLLELAVSLQMLLGEKLRTEQFSRLAKAWEIPGADSPLDVLALRLGAVEESLGQSPLAALRASLSEEDLEPIPWRSAHRSLRFCIPQPSIRAYLEPAFREALEMAGEEYVVQTEAVAVTASDANDESWQLVLEFGHSRSEFYPHVVDIAQKMPGYVQIMDEDRRLVHRVNVRKRDMRRFWRIWDYVQGWSTTHVYRNGEELERWKIWPYSQYLR